MSSSQSFVSKQHDDFSLRKPLIEIHSDLFPFTQREFQICLPAGNEWNMLLLIKSLLLCNLRAFKKRLLIIYESYNIDYFKGMFYPENVTFLLWPSEEYIMCFKLKILLDT